MKVKITDQRQVDVNRLVLNYKRISTAVEAIKLINGHEAWLLELQEKKIHVKNDAILEVLKEELKWVIDELHNIGGNAFVREVLK